MAYSFVMISPNLHAIWVFLLMNLSQDLKCFLLVYFGTLGDGYSLKGSKNKPSWHNCLQVFFYRFCLHNVSVNGFPISLKLRNLLKNLRF